MKKNHHFKETIKEEIISKKVVKEKYLRQKKKHEFDHGDSYFCEKQQFEGDYIEEEVDGDGNCA